MHAPLKYFVSMFVLLMCACSLRVHAQSASCSGVANWNPSTIYNAGDRMVHNNRLYQANQPIWNAAPDYCPSCGWYTDLGVCGGSNQAPAVAITAPTNGASFTAGANITINANASDGDGSVVRVEFFRGSVSLGVDTAAPFSITWNGATSGAHALTAVARDNGGANTTSPVVNITVNASPDTTAPSVPAGLASPSQTTNSIALSWSASTDNAGGSGVAGYDVYRNGSLVGSSTSTSYTDTGLAAATSYQYRVRARDNAGNASAQSGAVTVSTRSNPSDTTPPSVPAGLASPSQTSNSVSLTWSASTDNAGGSGVAGYDVYRNGAIVGSPTGTSYTDGGLAASTSYQYRVRARDNAGNASAQSGAITATTQPVNPGGSKRVIGYFVQWGIYGRNYRVRNIDTSGSAAELTHINYAFGNVRNNRCEVGINQPADPNTGVGGDAFADYTKAFNAAESVDGVADTWDQPLRGNWNQLKKLKARHPGLKVLISLGGWTWSRGFSDAARPENRVAFVASCIDAYIRGNLPASDGAGGAGAAVGVFDGIDLDWEYPVACGIACGRPEDNANFTALLAEFRRQLNAVRPGLLLTVAVGAGIDKIRVTDPGAYHASLDFINIMSYDYHGTWEGRTNFHSALFGYDDDPSTGDVRLYNTDDSVQAFLDRGVPASKLNVGIGFYGRGWTNVPNVNNGLYQTGTAAPATYEAGNEDYKVLKNLNWPAFTHAQSRARWIYNGTTFWTFDTPAAVAEKMQYVKQRNLGGAFFWEFSGDDANGTLAKTIGDNLNP
jgi:chitinase